MFQKNETPFDIPFDACLHPILPVSWTASKKEFIKNLFVHYKISFPSAFLPIDFFMGWNDESLYVAIQLFASPPYTSKWPKYRAGDALELFIDTRNMRSFRLLHRFCHHFILFPEAFEGVSSREITEFRTQETRKLSSDNSIDVEVIEKTEIPLLIATIPQESLFGWEPEDSHHIGFAFTLFSEKASPHILSFPLSSEKGLVQQEKFPYRWATLNLLPHTPLPNSKKGK